LVLRVSFILAAVFGFSLFVVTPAWAQACMGAVNVNLTKRVAPSRGIAPGDPVNHVIEISVTATGATTPVPCDLTIDLRDIMGPNLTFTGSSSGATCTGTNPVTCSVPFTGVDTAGQTKTVIIRTTAGDPEPGGYCDHADANAVAPAIGGDVTGVVCGAAEGEPTPPPNGGGGDLDEFDEGGFGGGFGGFGTGFSTVSTPLGGVDTGAGGTAGSNDVVPQVALASLLTIGFLLFGLRRLRRA
jgi:hypothetical protein